MAYDPTQKAHQEWLGYVQPVGLVVSIPALLEAGAAPDSNVIPLHRTFLETLPADRDGSPVPELKSFLGFAKTVLGWEEEDVAASPGGPPLPEDLSARLAEYSETLRPTFAVCEPEPVEGTPPWLCLGQELAGSDDFDQDPKEESRQWQASPQARFERLLRETGVPIGLLVNSEAIRLVYAPRGESSGHITCRIADMAQIAGRPILAALHMLLSAERLFSMASEQRLPALLANSRKYQNLVSTKLADQVLEALYELLRGFQAADDQARGNLLTEVLKTDPNQVYGGLLTVLLRLVFLLYAEDRNLLSSDPLFLNHYSVGGLFEKLREDAAHHPDTMDHRYGGWARLLTLFRLIWRGASHGEMRIPPRRGYLFDPDRYPFLEGRQNARTEELAVPRVSDGVLHRVLLKLLILDGERLSYRMLDVEQIGSVYEAIMGFDLHVAAGSSIGIKAKKKHGAPATINLEALLQVTPSKRKKWLRERTDQDITGQADKAVKSAETIDDLMAALDRRIAKNITPNPVPKGAMIFQPSEERRRSGSHYTPRSLTSPIVEHTLGPVLAELGERPTPDQILALKVCDPAMGSGAFLVEACRQLGAALVKAWHEHDMLPPIPADEDELLYAQRVVAQRCLYGVDKNPMATDLAKLSLWLATLARDHPFTFLDHSLRSGDSLVRLSARQIAAMHWAPGQQAFFEKDLRRRIRGVSQSRTEILAARENTPYQLLEQKLGNADQALDPARWAGDAVVAAFFEGKKGRDRESKRKEYGALQERAVAEDLAADEELRQAGESLAAGPKGVAPFHWEIEFPEVFQLDDHLHRTAGFDAMVGNPPFAGKNTLIAGHAEGYLDWLKLAHPESHGNADMVAHFYRSAFDLLRPGGRFGLIATNTIGQGDTRSTGLRWTCTHGGTIYRATKRLKWPGEAAVVVSVVHVAKGEVEGPYWLDGRNVDLITAYLFHAGGHEDPAKLRANKDKSFQGSIVLGMGFTFDDTDKKGVATPLAEMRRLIEKAPRNAERIFPYLGGEEVNDSPTHSHHRYVINFEDFPLRRDELGKTWEKADEDQRKEWLRDGIVPWDYPEPVAEDWPDLLAIVEEKVKGTRASHSTAPWWQFERPRIELYLKIRQRGLNEVFACAQTSNAQAFAALPADIVASHTTIILPVAGWSFFATLQSRVHASWAQFLGPTMKDDLRYTPSDCFETFPFADAFESNACLEATGDAYYRFRADLMVRNDEGLTKTYNRFHDPNERSPDIQKLRDLHDEVDRVVLDAYGWSDLKPVCEFFPEFDEDDEEQANSRRRKRYRYRWADELHDEVLARLLALNEQRAALEAETEKATKPQYGSKQKHGSKPTTRRRAKASAPSLDFGGDS